MLRDHAQLLLLDRDAVAAVLSTELALQSVREAFTLHGKREGRLFPVVREALADGVFGIKSGDVAGRQLLGLKAAGFWPGNRTLGGEPHQATVLLCDPQTGRPRCLMDGNAITTARTAAAGELGLQLLARADSSVLTVFGTGVQAQAQLAAALRTLPALRTVHYVARDGQRQPAFEARFAGRCDIAAASNADQAVADSDVVITATPANVPLFSTRALRPGTHINAVGADTRGKRELPDGLLAQVTMVVDDREQACALGELQWAPETPCVEIGDLLTGAATLTRQTDDVTVFDMTGLALQDLVLGAYIQDAALAAGHGRLVPWPW